jgi:hypothetical protein
MTALLAAVVIGVRLLVVAGVRSVVPDHGTREIKAQINRTILREFGAAGLEIASATADISSVPLAPGRCASMAEPSMTRDQRDDEEHDEKEPDGQSRRRGGIRGGRCMDFGISLPVQVAFSRLARTPSPTAGAPPSFVASTLAS